MLLWLCGRSQVTVPLLGGARLNQSQTGCCKFVPGSWSRYWWAGIDSGAFPGFTNRETTNCGYHGSACQKGTITKTVAQCCAGLVSTLLTIRNGEKIYELRFNQLREMAFTWYESGSGLYDAYLVHLIFRRLANRSISGFWKWSKRDLTTLSFKFYSLLS